MEEGVIEEEQQTGVLRFHFNSELDFLRHWVRLAGLQLTWLNERKGMLPERTSRFEYFRGNRGVKSEKINSLAVVFQLFLLLVLVILVVFLKERCEALLRSVIPECGGVQLNQAGAWL